MKNRVLEGRDTFVPRTLDAVKRNSLESKYVQPTTIKTTNVAQSSPVSVPNNSWTGNTITINPLLGQTMIGTVQASLHRDDASIGANEYPAGGNWSTTQVVNSAFETWADEATTDGKNINQFVIFKNRTGGSITVIFSGNCRVFDSVA